MIQNFDEVKRQLSELSDSINKFKSEQVQLKIVELIFKHATNGGGRDDDGAVDTAEQRVQVKWKKRKPRKTEALKAGTPKEPKSRGGSKPRGKGPAPTLQLLIDRGFFNQKRTI